MTRIQNKRYWVIWFPIFYAYWWLHELGHYLTNIISGMKMSQTYIIGCKISNIIVWPYATHTEIEPPRISLFMGGALAAFVLLSLSALFILIYRKNRKPHFFVLFSITLGIGLMGLLEMIVEPFFPVYHGTTLNALVLHGIAIIVPIAAYLLYGYRRTRINGQIME